MFTSGITWIGITSNIAKSTSPHGLGMIPVFVVTFCSSKLVSQLPAEQESEA